MELDDIVLDDSALLADRLVRSLHRNNDGHLAVDQQHHENSVDTSHNVAVLYIYTVDAMDTYMLHEHYVYSHQPCSYDEWKQITLDEISRIEEKPSKDYYGVYGWSTAHVKITPLRTGDLFIKIDKEGARGVRLSFNTGKAKREARSKN